MAMRKDPWELKRRAPSVECENPAEVEAYVGRGGSGYEMMRGTSRRRCTVCFGCLQLGALAARRRFQDGIRRMHWFGQEHEWPDIERMVSDLKGYTAEHGRFLTLTWKPGLLPYSVAAVTRLFGDFVRRLRKVYGVEYFMKFEPHGAVAGRRLHFQGVLLNVPRGELLWRGVSQTLEGVKSPMSEAQWRRADLGRQGAREKFRVLDMPGFGFSACQPLRLGPMMGLADYLCKEVFHQEAWMSTAEIDAMYRPALSRRRINRYMHSALFRTSSTRLFDEGAQGAVPTWEEVRAEPGDEALISLGELVQEVGVAPSRTGVAREDVAAMVAQVVVAGVEALRGYDVAYRGLNARSRRLTRARRAEVLRLIKMCAVDLEAVVHGEFEAEVRVLRKVSADVTQRWRGTGVESWLRNYPGLWRKLLEEER